MKEDLRVARYYLGYFVNDGYKELIQIEYRYARNYGFDFYVNIRNKPYITNACHFFGGLAKILDQLPPTSALVILHKIPIIRKSVEEIATLEEWLFPFSEAEKPTNTIVYQLKLFTEDGFYVETPKKTEHGYSVIDFGCAAEYLRRLIGEAIQIKICYFCFNLLEYNDNGGTDCRHDKLYCFRDSPEVLNLILGSRLTSEEIEISLLQGIADMSALHSCMAFVYRSEHHSIFQF